MASHLNSGTITSGGSYPVSAFSSYTVYAANTSTVTTKVNGNVVATYTVGTTGTLTITDLADSVSVNANFVVVGLLSNTQS